MSVLIALLVLSTLVLIHELGHFFIAKLFGVDIEEFGIGLPPKARTLFKKNETEFTLNWLPLGGFVRLLGEDREEKIEDPTKKMRALYFKPVWQRILIMLGGIFANLVLGIVIFSGIYSIKGVPYIEGDYVGVVAVADGSPADYAGIKPNDVIVRVENNDVESVDNFINLIDVKKGESVNLYVGEMNEEGVISDGLRQISLIPRENPPEGEGSIGVSIASVGEVVYEKKPWYSAPFYGAVEGVKESYFWGKEILSGLALVGSSLMSGALPEGVAGPIGIVQVTAQVSESGILMTLRFMAILSMNLAIFNLLPIPILDGGRILMLFIERIIGRKKIERIEKWVYMVGVVMMTIFFVLVSWNDIVN